MRPFDWFRPAYPVAKRGILNLKSGTSLRGLIVSQVGRYLVLRQSQLMEDRGKAAAGSPPVIDGEVLVDHRDVDFIQLLTPREPGA